MDRKLLTSQKETTNKQRVKEACDQQNPNWGKLYRVNSSVPSINKLQGGDSGNWSVRTPQTLQRQHHLGTCSKCKFSSSTSDLESEALGWSPAVCVLMSLEADSDALWSENRYDGLEEISHAYQPFAIWFLSGSWFRKDCKHFCHPETTYDIKKLWIFSYVQWYWDFIYALKYLWIKDRMPRTFFKIP